MLHLALHVSSDTRSPIHEQPETHFQFCCRPYAPLSIGASTIRNALKQLDPGSILRPVVEERVARTVLEVRFVRKGAEEANVTIEEGDVVPAQDFVVVPSCVFVRQR